jgi:hypothetical protein
MSTKRKPIWTVRRQTPDQPDAIVRRGDEIVGGVDEIHTEELNAILRRGQDKTNTCMWRKSFGYPDSNLSSCGKYFIFGPDVRFCPGCGGKVVWK